MTNLLRLIGKRTRAQFIQDYFFITLGIALYAIGYTAFVLPEQLVSGGVTGISSLLYYAFKWNPAVMIWGLNGLLLLISFKGLSRQFTIRTIVGVTILSLMVALMKVVFEKFPLITPGEDRFMHIVIGALLGGSGLGLVFAHNGSTGGTDIIVALVNRYSRLSLGRVMQFVDISIICSSYILFHSAELIVYGVVFIVISSIMVDYVVNGTRQTVQFMIISKRYKTMADAINQNMGRGVTILHGQGWYSKSDVEVVMVLCRKYESQYLFNLIKAIDPDAMVSQSFCHGVFGEGFDKIK
ncbi:MAG: YitT family protein [Bacteroidales bacterium]|nr:YitT family protein [Bacteroidales bacterium]MBP5680807.1 YitT family protein [Bacteroidales bacterium]